MARMQRFFRIFLSASISSAIALIVGRSFIVSHPAMAARYPYQERVLYTFSGQSDGQYPETTLINDASGALYGATIRGGSGDGVVFKLTPSPSGYVESVLYAFTGLSGNGDGALPYGAIVRDRTGAIYGTTYAGGIPSYNSGTVYKLTPTASGYAETVLYRFGNWTTDGEGPWSGLTAGPNGTFYGTTGDGGRPNLGCVFELVPTGSGYQEQILHFFQEGGDGQYPMGTLVLGSKGELYGTTKWGGSAGSGSVYELIPRKSGFVERVIHSFGGTNDGAFPIAPLVMSAAGDLYGTTTEGGPSYCGTVFELQRTGNSYAERVLYGFKCGADGRNPQGGVVIGKYRALYGTVMMGGVPEQGGCPIRYCGEVYKLSPTAHGFRKSTLFAFATHEEGDGPQNTLLQGRDGTLFGMTFKGGDPDAGNIFAVAP